MGRAEVKLAGAKSHIVFHRNLIRGCALISSLYLSGLIASGPADAGAWPLKKGTSQMIVTVTKSRADKEFKADGTTMDVRNFGKMHFEAYYQYGYDNKTTLIADLVYAKESVDVAEFTFATSKFRTASLGARHYIGKWEDTRYSVELLTTLHLAKEGSDPVPSKGGDLDFELAVITGSHFKVWGGKGFIENRLSSTYRPTNRPYEVSAESTIGFHPYTDGLVLIKSSNFIQMEYEMRAQTYVTAYKADVSLVHRISPTLSIELGGGTTFAGNNISKDTHIKIGFWYDF
ncbi:MAG: hypothetical protein ACJAXQ_000395 [Parvibaculaceae bacterium]|jgi:hypothetical protein